MAENKEEKKEVIENKETPKKETPKKEEVKKVSPKEDKKFEPVKSSSETKKATNTAKPKAEKGKKASVALRAIAVVVVLALVVGIIYIVLPSPARELQQMLKDLKSGNYDKVVDYDELIDSSVISTSNDEQRKLFFEDLEFTVKEVKQEGDTAKITLETTNKDFKSIVQKAVTKLVQKYFSSENAEIENVFIEELQNENVEKVTTTQTITVQKQSGKWRVVVDDNLKNAILPGLAETLETLTNGNMFSESE